MSLADRKLTPAEIVGLAYEYADALKAAENAAVRLWRALPPERDAAFEASDVDTFAAEKAVRALADAWQGELDGEQA